MSRVTTEDSLRTVVLSSWGAARRLAAARGVYIGTAASVAGQYLELAGGDVSQAIDMLPVRGGKFWDRVVAILTAVRQEERAQRVG